MVRSEGFQVVSPDGAFVCVCECELSRTRNREAEVGPKTVDVTRGLELGQEVDRVGSDTR